MAGSFEHNIDEVIGDIDDVKSDMRHEFRKRLGEMMNILRDRAQQYVAQDADVSGDLYNSIHKDVSSTSDGFTFKVATDATKAPHAAVVEFGSGDKTLDPWVGSQNTFPPSSTPSGFPYEGPDVNFDPETTYELEDGTDFSQLVGVIFNWMEEKPVQPETGSMMQSAFLIAKEIAKRGTHAHPYMRPAWFDTVLEIRKAAKNALRNSTR